MEMTHGLLESVWIILRKKHIYISIFTDYALVSDICMSAKYEDDNIKE